MEKRQRGRTGSGRRKPPGAVRTTPTAVARTRSPRSKGTGNHEGMEVKRWRTPRVAPSGRGRPIERSPRIQKHHAVIAGMGGSFTDALKIMGGSSRRRS